MPWPLNQQLQSGPPEYALNLVVCAISSVVSPIFCIYIIIQIIQGPGPKDTVGDGLFQDLNHEEYPSLHIPSDILPYLGVPPGNSIDIRGLCACENFSTIIDYFPFDIEDYDTHPDDYDIYYSEKMKIIKDKDEGYGLLSYKINDTGYHNFLPGFVCLIITIGIIVMGAIFGLQNYDKSTRVQYSVISIILILVGLYFSLNWVNLTESKKITPNIGGKDDLLDERTINNKGVKIDQFNRLPNSFVNNGDEGNNLNPYNLSYKLLRNENGLNEYNGGCRRNKTLCKKNFYDQEQEYNFYEGVVSDNDTDKYCIPWKTLVVGLHRYLIDKHWNDTEDIERLNFYAFNNGKETKNGGTPVIFNQFNSDELTELNTIFDGNIPKKLQDAESGKVYWKGFGYVIFILTQVRNNTYIRDKIDFDQTIKGSKKDLYEFYDDNFYMTPDTQASIYTVILVLLSLGGVIGGGFKLFMD